jgi:RNA 2',3'-cyclic 3'-phosphodiesterase
MNNQGETIRAFVAVELPARVLESLASLQDDLREQLGRAAGTVRWTRPEGLHITLQFLGDVPSAQVDAIGEALQTSIAGQRVAKLAISKVGAFPNENRPRILWVGLDGDIPVLSGVASAVADGLKSLGYSPDKPFKPHITLGRVREHARPDEVRAIAQALEVAQEEAHEYREEFTAGAVSLMKSKLGPGGSVYTRLEHAAIGPVEGASVEDS